MHLGSLDTVGDDTVRGKTVIVTGPTRCVMSLLREIFITPFLSGIGTTTAWELARRGAHVILACRNVEKGTKLKYSFEERAHREGLSTLSLEIMQLDVSQLKSVREFVSRWRSSERPLHVLINNAGIFDIGGLITPQRHAMIAA